MLHPTVADATFWAAVACCLVAHFAILRSALRLSRQHRALAERVPRPRRAAEFAWALIPAALVAVVLAFTWQAIRAAEGPAREPGTRAHFVSGS